MEYKILESLGTEISNVDGAAFNNFCAGNQDGIIGGILENCDIVKLDSETVMVSSGELLIQGFRIKITSPYTITKPSNLTALPYYLIAQVNLTSTGGISFNIEARQTPELKKDKLFTKNSGTYEIELCRFMVGPDGISNLSRTVGTISSKIYTGTVVIS
jgi:hypothetical protein